MISNNSIQKSLHIAPMMKWTDRHCRYFFRLLSKKTWLYSEMVTTDALLHGETQRLLAYDKSEHPLVLQLGGSDPKALAHCSQLAEDHGYDAVNLNVGCPSDRVQQGRIGACLFKTPALVADCLQTMQHAVSIPVTLKTRIGVDDLDSEENLHHFTNIIAASGCHTIIFHARKAWLRGLDPKQNRTIPPLHYDRVHRLKLAFPNLEIIINGGIQQQQEIETQLHYCDGVMIGRAAYHNPYLLSQFDNLLTLNEQQPIPTRAMIVAQMTDYLIAQKALGVTPSAITRHLLGLFHGTQGAKIWRRYISSQRCAAPENTQLLTEALQLIS